MPGKYYSNRTKQLPEDGEKLGRAREAIFALKDPEPVAFHLLEKLSINQAHNLGAEHRPAILPRQGRRRLAKISVGAIGFELH